MAQGEDRLAMITAEHFKAAVGRDPHLDDLERANCKEAGAKGHSECGWCPHDKPVWFCPKCFAATVEHRASARLVTGWRRGR